MRAVSWSRVRRQGGRVVDASGQQRRHGHDRQRGRDTCRASLRTIDPLGGLFDRAPVHLSITGRASSVGQPLGELLRAADEPLLLRAAVDRDQAFQTACPSAGS